MKPFIDPSFWSDPDIEAQKAGVKLCTLWLITNSQTSLLGVCGASSGRFCFETNLPLEALQSTLKALPKSFIKVGDVIFIRNFIRHQFGTGEKLMRNNFFVALKSLFLSVKDESLRAVILKEYPEFQEALTKGLPRAYQAQGGKGKERRVREFDVGSCAETISLCRIFRRELTTEWSKGEIAAFKSIGKIDLSELALVERFYQSNRTNEKAYLRTGLQAFCNNFRGEVDKARAWADKNPRTAAKINGATKPHDDPKPEGFDDWLAEVYPRAIKEWKDIPQDIRKEFYEQRKQVANDPRP